MRWFLLILLILPAPALAVDCSEVPHGGNTYSVCEVDLTKDDLQLFLKDPEGKIIGHFYRLEELLEERTLPFAMNAGMYHPDRAPVGHFIENGQEVMRIIPNAGPGNFGMLPNGVLCIRSKRADVIETLRYADEKPSCQYATQSGPMLVIDGKRHNSFLPDSTFRNIRNGVGTSKDGKRAIFAISDNSVTFYEFASLFLEHFELENALYFDGRISRLHAPQLERSDVGVQMGPIIGVVD
ncbi:phosphodiester glycosidase family protein [Parasulfitobacter algicola]|uniref:Phosphodiester glycosidase family protein n=1 Tax=Parasulfitobacter algicola TaxID=2614809 RepID=A0ABX2IV53_9RHOB|nr:phosphodiester glycosidase family protein [Sulfitobacter algicola]NSX54073.1 phosphodiester glycosidase family protein [Sulfitobacter algicola]